MLDRRRILIVEDEALIAAYILDAVERADGEPVGPAATVAEALALLDSQDVHAAILDVHLFDCEVTPVAHRLLAAGKPVVFHTASAVPPEITARHGEVAICPKPSPPTTVVRILAELINGAG
ncbi:MAG TPA: response regulator [Caulobacteraceae bacterium]|nr:response regulator [Caulobacteraceae bacterium]